ncbi:WXG100 family type VII secretion target [Mycobacterium noviomagense]|uniref:ESAT-6-like protein n=1 Tax=Mycobacterium noviomagense TaxID=459858 RepID=A0A7I7PG02_9MYCO|nr:WXG100 family type VII secretion target [Mycobacterium noviomagense]ORB17132.1 WXG100 family type VII secretion target [Mycobacterium noviomagense]BBY07520.1 ESAT-6-like protein EsxE [Mycobacterium noviomagense]
MAEAFRVDPEALAEAVEHISEFQRYAESMLSEIDSMVSNLHATWTGEAAAAHAEAHRHWSRGEAMMREALTKLQGAAKTAHANYTGAMAKNVGMWS